MSQIVKHSLRYSLIVVVIAIFCQGCDFIFPSDQFSEHEFKISNQTESDVWVEYFVENRWLDSARTSYGAQLEFVDTAFVMKPRSYHLLFTSQFKDFHRYRMDTSKIAQRIIKLKFYEIRGADSVLLDINHLDEDRWDHTDSDPISYTQITHYYLLPIWPADLD